jgi:hypothetical protein
MADIVRLPRRIDPPLACSSAGWHPHGSTGSGQNKSESGRAAPTRASSKYEEYSFVRARASRGRSWAAGSARSTVVSAAVSLSSVRSTEQPASGTAPAFIRRLTRAVVTGLLLCSACANGINTTAEPPLPDRAVFDATVYPMLLRDCGFSECHGGEHRFFQVFGPGRNRLAGHPSDPDLGPRERQLTYDRTRSMLVAAGGGTIFESPLLTKPLEIQAGGASHEGVDRFGRNLFQTVADPRYVMLWQWATATPQPTAAAPAGAAPSPVLGPPMAPPSAAGAGAGATSGLSVAGGSP